MLEIFVCEIWVMLKVEVSYFLSVVKDYLWILLSEFIELYWNLFNELFLGKWVWVVGVIELFLDDFYLDLISEFVIFFKELCWFVYFEWKGRLFVYDCFVDYL